MEEILKSSEIELAQEQLVRELKEALPGQGKHKLGYRGGGRTLKLYSEGRGHLYFAREFVDRPGTTPRYWNAFGFYDGNALGQQRIAVEINIPRPASRLIAGFFARSRSSGEIVLLHDGKIGGGKKGVSREAFLHYSGLRPVRVHSVSNREGIVVATLGDPNLARDVEHFARIVMAFKGSLN